MSDWNKLDEEGYRVIPPKKEVVEKGVKCGLCGMKFDHGRAYGFVCSNTQCPMQMNVTC